MIVAERNRRISLRGDVQNDIDVTIRFLQGRLKQLDERLKALIDKDPEWNRTLRLSQRPELALTESCGVPQLVVS